MTYSLTVLDTKLGLHIKRPIDAGFVLPDDPETRRHIWGDGNYSCDCNRSRFVSGWDDLSPVAQPHQCGDFRYVVVSIKDDDTGEILYEDCPV